MTDAADITVSGLWKSYGERAVLRDLSFRVERGVPLCLTAPSGGGKTTLLRVLLGLERPDRGSVRRPEPCRWSAVFQEDRLIPHWNARDNLRFVLGRAYRTEDAAAMLEALGLADAGEKPVRDYSGGMRRRLALARALLPPFDALALDEPFTGLDAENRRRCLEAIRRSGAGKLVVLATHDPADAAALNGEICALNAT